MAERLKDAEDRLLEAMFQSEPIADAGFSRSVVTHIRRRIWLRRLALPVAMVVGGAVAVKPVSELALAATKLLTVVPQDMLEVPAAWVPQVWTVVLGAMLLAAGMLGMRMIED